MTSHEQLMHHLRLRVDRPEVILSGRTDSGPNGKLVGKRMSIGTLPVGIGARLTDGDDTQVKVVVEVEVLLALCEMRRLRWR